MLHPKGLPMISGGCNIFEVLPNDLIGEILVHINSIELIYSFGRVCKYWRKICCGLIWEDYERTIEKFKIGKDCKRFEDLDKFLESKSGRKFVKYLLRRQVYELSSKLATIATISEDQRWFTVNNQWVDTEIAILKGYFNEFSDLNEQPKVQQPNSVQKVVPASKGLFGGALSFIGSFFSSNPKSTNAPTTTAVTPSSVPEKKLEYDYITKTLLDGDYGSGKTSLLNAAMNNIPVTDPNTFIATIGIDFAMKTFKIGETTRVKLQLWDQCGPERFRSITTAYYRGASVILLLVDPYSQYSMLQNKLHDVKYNSPNAEVVFITTKKDQKEDAKKKMTNDEADLFAFENFGGLHLNITNTEVEEPRNIVWYCALMKYLLSEPVTKL